MDHAKAISDKVEAMFSVDRPSVNSIWAEVHRSASAKVNDILGSVDYQKYVDIFLVMTEADYATILSKEYYLQTDTEKIFMICENAEATLYMYYLLDKLELISEDDLRYKSQTFGSGSIKPEDVLDMISARDKYLNSATDMLYSISFDSGTVAGQTGFFMVASDNVDYSVDETEEV